MLNLQCHLLNQVRNNTKTVKAFYSQRMGWLDGITGAIDMNLGKLEIVRVGTRYFHVMEQGGVPRTQQNIVLV